MGQGPEQRPHPATVLRFLELLGVQSTVQYLQAAYTTSKCLQSLAERGQVGNLESAWSANSQLRQVQLAEVQALFTSSKSTSSKSIAFTASSDPGMLQRAEWIKFVAVFFNQEAEAQRVFETIRQDYQFQVRLLSNYRPPPPAAFPPFPRVSSARVSPAEAPLSPLRREI